jgi:undecaprenyl-diphosphatase
LFLSKNVINVVQSALLGILQGLGEFLPISSTAHLILLPWFFNWPDPGLAFDVALHIGTLIAVVLFFWRDWIHVFKSASNSVFHTKYALEIKKYPTNLLWLLVLASVPGAVFGLLLESKVEGVFRSPLLIAFTLSVVGVVLFLVDRYSTHRKGISEITKKDALIIGISQAVAIIPGVSRSGATMTAGLALGLNREQAARFSFLLSTPIIFGAAAIKVPQLIQAGITLPIIIGILASALTGFLAIKFMLRYIQKVGYAPFLWYRLILAGIIVVIYISR